ncbi:M23 family metallopeptidase [Pseudonocardia alni]|uniref:M23 family metallopeptidase n=1 Tax=Pseudonocardia alni TaxID=33907 RepID=UPI003320A557
MPPPSPSAPPPRGPRHPSRPGWRAGLRAGAVLLAVVVTGVALVPPGAAVAAPVVPAPVVPTPEVAAPVVAARETAVPTPEPPPGADGLPPPPGGAPAPGGPPDGTGPAPAPPRPPGAGIPAPGADYAWPLLPPPAVTAVFRRPAFRYGRGHRGADLAGSPGQAVLVAREGVVVFAGRIAGRGVVSVDHPDGLRSTYEPVSAAVVAGARLAGGDPVGTLEPGHTGCPVAACLHWGVRRERLDHLDPLVLLRPPRVRLLPWKGAPEPAEGAPERVSPPAQAPSSPAAG